MNIKKFEKEISKIYWDAGQRLYVSPTGMFDKKNDFSCDITLTDETGKEYGEFLFEIQTLDCFQDLAYKGASKSYFSDRKMIQTSTLVDVAHTPLYIDRMFTLKKFGCITEKDIYNCTNYFVKEILGSWMIFNIRVKIQYEKRSKR